MIIKKVGKNESGKGKDEKCKDVKILYDSIDSCLTSDEKVKDFEEDTKDQ